MLNKITILLTIGSLCLFLFGCSDNGVTIDADMVMSSMEDSMEKTEGESTVLVIETSEEDTKEPDENTEDLDKDTMETEEERELLTVHICGAVIYPGVYQLEAGARLYEAVKAAGGFREDADTEYLNLALLLEDGIQVVLPTRQEAVALRNLNPHTGNITYDSKPEPSSEKTGDSKVNINTADEKLLCTLPGIGESRAKSIIAYREEHGGFGKKEDIMKVSGIKEAAYSKIENYITVTGSN